MNIESNPIIDILRQLIRFESITPSDADCQEYMITMLEELGFRCQRMNQPPVSNFYAEWGQGDELLLFAGHTDVVPVGDFAKWHTNPFELYEENGMLYGRGVADMKGSLACMLIAASHIIQANPQGKIGFLITSGEEGDEYNLGTPFVMNQLNALKIHPTFCIVGEPSSSTRTADVIKIGRRGSLTGKLNLQGQQGHVAYPHLAINPIHTITSALLELINFSWDKGNAYFPPTSFQITHIKAGGEANNIIPGELTLHFNIRYSTEQTQTSLQNSINNLFKRHGLTPKIEWSLNGEPFLTSKGRLLDSCIKVIEKCTQQQPELSTSGGTSDGRFIAPFGIEVVELGPVNATIHQINECVSLTDLQLLTKLYILIALDLFNCSEG